MLLCMLFTKTPTLLELSWQGIKCRLSRLCLWCTTLVYLFSKASFYARLSCSTFSLGCSPALFLSPPLPFSLFFPCLISLTLSRRFAAVLLGCE